MNSPILLSDSLTVPQNGVVETTTSRMQNPFRTAMLIDEMRFRTPLLEASITFGAHLSIRAEILLGRTPLTNGFVPVGNLGRTLLDGTIHFGDIPQLATFYHTWKLAKPLYVPPTELLISRIHYDGRFGGPASTTVDVTYVGRSLSSNEPKPKSIFIPWATSFDVPLLALADGNSDSTISNESSIVNPFNEQLSVQRFMGRTLRKGHNIIGAGITTELGGGVGDQAATQMTTVRAIDSFGNNLIRDPTPFTHLFGFTDRAWTVNAVLPPKGFYVFQVDRDYTITVSSTSLAHAISMIGYRKVLL